MEVLKRTEFYDVVEEMHLECVRFDHIVHISNLDKIRRFSFESVLGTWHLELCG